MYGAFLCTVQNDIFCPTLCIYRSTVHSYLISFCTLLQSLYDITPETPFTVCLLPQSGRKLVARKKTDRFVAFVSWENWAVYVRVSVSLVLQTHKKKNINSQRPQSWLPWECCRELLVLPPMGFSDLLPRETWLVA